VIENTYVGKTRAQIVQALGQPTREWEGIYGLPPQDYVDRHPGARTLYYEWPSGRFYAAVERVRGHWVCFESHWVPKGTVLD
jgi:hypothetical protein